MSNLSKVYTKENVGGIAQAGSGSDLRLIWHNAGAPTNGTNGTLAGLAQPGDLLVTDEVAFYQNTNTAASPTWTALTTATGAGTYTGTFNGTVGGSTPAAGTFTSVNDSGAMTVGGALTGLTASLSGGETVGGTLKVTGASTLGGAASITGAITAASTLNLAGAATIAGATIVFSNLPTTAGATGVLYSDSGTLKVS